jgi:hypothetical protein
MCTKCVRILVYVDVNGDGKADLAIMMKAVSTLVKGDFFL